MSAKEGAVLETFFTPPKNEDDANLRLDFGRILNSTGVRKNGKNTYHCNRRHIVASCLSVQVDF